MGDSGEAPATTAASFGRRFWPPLGAGLLGVATLPLIVLPVLEARAAATQGMSLRALAALAMIQPAVLVAAAAAIGAALAHRVGFVSHLANVNVRGRALDALPPAIASGLVAGFAIVVADRTLFGGLAPPRADATASADPMLPGLLAGVLYGGLTEEVMMRWGLMTLVVWGALRLFARGDTRARPHDRRSSAICVTAIVVVALVFAAGHLPAAAAMAPLTSLGITRILSLNTIAGMLFGWLYWRRSLEAAMIAHASVHVAFAVARVLHWTTP